MWSLLSSVAPVFCWFKYSGTQTHTCADLSQEETKEAVAPVLSRVTSSLYDQYFPPGFIQYEVILTDSLNSQRMERTSHEQYTQCNQYVLRK